MSANVTDRLEITELFARLAYLLDEKRWADAGTVYADDVVARSPRGAEIHGLDQLIDFLCKAEVEGVHTQHRHTDVLVEVTGEQATVSAYELVHFYREGEPPHQTSGLRLNHTAVRTPAGWRFRGARITLAWTRKD